MLAVREYSASLSKRLIAVISKPTMVFLLCLMQLGSIVSWSPGDVNKPAGRILSPRHDVPCRVLLPSWLQILVIVSSIEKGFLYLCSWAAYVAGPLVVLMHELGLRYPQGISLLLSSAVPEGKGVSSSAAVEVAVMQALCAAHDVHIDGRHLALLCQKVKAQPDHLSAVDSVRLTPLTVTISTYQ